MKKKAIILARVSTAGQAEEELPIDSQLEAGRAEAARLEAEVVKVFVEDGVSGRKLKRDVFQEAIDYCAVFEIDYFILWNTARFARHRALAAWTKFNLRKHGTELVYVSQKINTATDEGWLLEGLFELMDENYSRTVSKDTLRSMMKNARDGFFNGGRVPYGYVVIADGKRKRLAMLEEEACVVRRIFAECVGGAGTKAIALWLNQVGISRRGQKWTKNTVGYLLRNWVYVGYVTFNRLHSATRAKQPEQAWVRTKSHPEIVSEEQFALVQQVMSEREPKRNGGSALSQYLFTGLAKCGACGMGMQIQTGTGRGGKVYSYYKCGGSLKGKGCGMPAIRAEAFDSAVMGVLLERVLAKPRLEEVAQQIEELSGRFAKEREKRRELLVAQLRDAERRRGNLISVLEEHGRNAPNLGDLSARLRELNAQTKALEAGLTELEDAKPPRAEHTARTLETIGAFVEQMMVNGEPRKVREFLGTFVTSVDVLEKGGALIHYDPARLVAAPDAVQSTGNWLPDLVTLRTVLPVEFPARALRRAA